MAFCYNMNMQVIRFENKYFDQTSLLLAKFRKHLRSFKGEVVDLNIESAKEELSSFLTDSNYPVYICLDNDIVTGYMILKLDGCVWVEQIYVREDYRRKGVASLFYQEAEKVSQGDTLFNYVHPNNDVMIAFLRSKGYTVLNLIEIRKPWKDEKTKTIIEVGNNKFDY